MGNTNNENLVFMSNILEVQAVKKSKEIIMWIWVLSSWVRHLSKKISLHIAAFAFGKRCCKWKVFLKWIVSDFEGTLTTYV